MGIGDWINLLITHYSLLITPYYWGLGIGLIYSLLITPYSLLLSIGDWGLGTASMHKGMDKPPTSN
ncbi:MAG: hypothetical protein ACSI46_29005 [Gloeotrichia echinulata DVL01]